MNLFILFLQCFKYVRVTRYIVVTLKCIISHESQPYLQISLVTSSLVANMNVYSLPQRA